MQNNGKPRCACVEQGKVYVGQRQRFQDNGKVYVGQTQVYMQDKGKVYVGQVQL